jgi:hypothetical protein
MNVWRLFRAGAVFIAVAMALCEVHVQGRAEHFLDLVDVVPPSASGIDPSDLLRVRPSDRSGGDSHAPRPVSPLTITLASLDRARYVVGDKVVYEVVVTNTSGRALRFPTLVDPRIVRRGMSEATLARVGLIFEDAVFGMQIVASQTLYGATAVPNSMELLQPGDSLRIRASGAWWLQSALKPGVPSRVVRDIALKGRLHMVYMLNDVPIQRSENAVPIQLQLNY